MSSQKATSGKFKNNIQECEHEVITAGDLLTDLIENLEIKICNVSFSLSVQAKYSRKQQQKMV